MPLSPSALGDLDPFFVCDYTPHEDGAVSDPAGPQQRGTTYWDVTKGSRGPQPLPAWVIVDAGAVDTELGVLKTGKEADVFLLERSATDGTGLSTLMAAKRYRDVSHRSFQRSTAYTDGRRMKKSRDARALARGSTYGKELAAGQWAYAEFDALKRYWSAGLPVPYPVQLDGTEILMEFIGDGHGGASPRLAQLRPDAKVLEGYFAQFVAAVTMLATHGAAHGDLSPYNVLADGADIVIIDLPQVVDLVGNPRGREFLMRDCHNMCSWFTSRGLMADAQDVFDQAVAAIAN